MIIESEIKTYQLKDSAADSKLKLLKEGEVFGVEKPGGEKRIHIGSIANEAEYDKFFFPDNAADVVFEVSKLDLIQYLLSAKDEFLHPSQRYRMQINTFYEKLLKDTISKVSDIFYIRFIKNCDNKRYYITRPAGDKWATNYTFISQICLPLVSRFNFIRNKYDDNTYKFYLKPIFVGQMKEASAPDTREIKTLQQIYYGAPGTGKSHEVKIITGELDGLGKECQCKNVFRTTFHPDTDYATFVGCYKPTMKTVEEKYRAVAGKEEDIVYEFVPQAFTDAYIYAYKNPAENTFLVIEEINRGNCAQIFGDLFQLLDRNGEGISEYTIKADKDLAKYLTKELGADSDGIKEGKLRLPANLHILATMNTSDQSLFPMDSAFKRRWDWRYVAISYSEPKSSTFKINVGEGYSWVDFIEQVNKRIFDLTQSEDKEMGNFFIKDSIDAEQFKSKVMFYLWFEVLRDEVENSKYFFYYTTQDESGKETNHKFTFKDLYGEKAETILEGFLKYITKGAE